MNAPNERFTSLVAALASAFRQVADEPMFMAYWFALEDVGIDSIQDAVKRSIRDCKYMPTASELRGMSTNEVPVDHHARMAWEDVRAGMMIAGPYNSVNFDDKIINATIRNMGGWIRLCEIEDDKEMTFERHRFEKTYASILRHGVMEGKSTNYLGGLHEQLNGKPDEIVAIGFDNRTLPPVRMITNENARLPMDFAHLVDVKKGVL